MRSRLLLAVLFAFVIAIVAPSRPANAQCGSTNLPCDVSSQTSSLAASSGGCFPPSAAVDLYLEASDGFAIRGGSSTPEACEKICDKFEDTCDDIAKIAKTCQNRGGGKYAELSRATCATFDDPDDRRACKDEVNGFRNFVRDCTNADRVRAAGCCANHRTICIKDCLAVPILPGDYQACFTGPGGYAGGTCYFSLLNNTF